jgi:Uracil DNA glycosylase superfamily
MKDFDSGPPAKFADIFSRVPDYSPFKDKFWYDWGPIFYRGRLDGSARVLCIASDPGPTERVAGRTLVGDAGQRVQGFLSKLGITRSYLCLNAFAYALFPSNANDGPKILKDPAQLAWRNELYTAAKTTHLQAILAFGMEAQAAIDLWPDKGTVPVFKIPHPSNHDEAALLHAWQVAIPQIRLVVTPDSNGNATGANYGTTFTEADYARIPLHDLPFGVPPWFGDDAWGRNAHPAHNNCVKRPSPDDHHTLTWIAPKS